MSYADNTNFIKKEINPREGKVSAYQMICGKCDKLKVCKYSEKVKELTEKICKEIDDSEDECGRLITFNIYCKENPLRISR